MAFYKNCLLLQNILLGSSKYSAPCRKYTSLLYKKTRIKINNYYLASVHTTNITYKRRKTAEEKKSPRLIEYSPKAKGEFIDVWRNITIKELAKLLNKDLKYVFEMFLNKFDDPNTPITDIKVLQQGIVRSGRRMRIIAKPEDDIDDIIKKDVFPRPPPKKTELKPRPPVVTVMGHIDHGKTTLLDALRGSKVVDQEFGGITQHIGAFSVNLKSGACITFLDTPGHAAFTAMRSRGANLTDIVILVVAADDGVMEQTIESIRMAKSAKVPLLVAINKIDAPKADIARTERTLVEAGVQVENLGGDVQAIPISALKKQNIDLLTEALMLQADMLQIGADPTGPVEAVVVESKVHPYRGKLCTVIVQRGTLQKGDVLIAGTSIAKVRALKDSNGNHLQKVSPGYPAEIEGWRQLPAAGEQVLQVESEKKARDVQKFRESELEKKKMEEDSKEINLKVEQHQREYKEKLELKRKMGRFKLKPTGPRKPEILDNNEPALNIIVKADVDGTLEAILNVLDTYESQLCKLDLVHYGIGSITENDLELAKVFNGVIYAFNVDIPSNLKELIETVPIKSHNVIYKLIDDVKEEINARLPLKEEEEVLGEAKVLQIFEITLQGRKKVPVAGCRCEKGILKRASLYKVIRNEEVIHEGPLSSMRHLKDEVDTIKFGVECGLQFVDKNVVFEKDDLIVCFQKKTVPQVTDWNPGF